MPGDSCCNLQFLELKSANLHPVIFLIRNVSLISPITNAQGYCYINPFN